MAGNKQRLTPHRIAYLPHPEKGKSFLWDADCAGLGVLATPTKKNFIFEGRLANKKTIRMTIGNVQSWTVQDARRRVVEIKQLINSGIDPRNEIKRKALAEERTQTEFKRQEVGVAEVWEEYLFKRKPYWSERHYENHTALASRGGALKKRGKGRTAPGALAPLMDLSLAQINKSTIRAWMLEEGQIRPTQTRLGYECIRAFLNWCEDQPKYKGIAALDSCSNSLKKELLPKKRPKQDCLLKEQLPAWFSAVTQYHNEVFSVYFQVLLLTGARREEIASMKWEDVSFKWRFITIKDKVDGQRNIPMTPYVAILLQGLPRRNQWVFSSPRAKSGRITSPFKPFRDSCQLAGIEGLTVHGLRRSFGSLAEWLEMPVGIVYQIQGHKQSATAEKHYRIRPLDLLRVWHEKFETWILEQAGISPSIEADREPVVKGAEGLG